MQCLINAAVGWREWMMMMMGMTFRVLWGEGSSSPSLTVMIFTPLMEMRFLIWTLWLLSHIMLLIFCFDCCHTFIWCVFAWILKGFHMWLYGCKQSDFKNIDGAVLHILLKSLGSVHFIYILKEISYAQQGWI